MQIPYSRELESYHFNLLDVVVSLYVRILEVGHWIKVTANEILPDQGQEVKAIRNVSTDGDSQQLKSHNTHIGVI